MQRISAPSRPGPADGVHHLAQKISISEIIDRFAARLLFLLEFLDLARRDLAKVVRKRLAGFELRAVDQEGAEAGAPATMLVDVGEERKLAGDDARLLVVALAFGLFVAGNPVIDELGRRCIVAHHDEYRRAAKLRLLLPLGKHFVIVLVKRLDCRFEQVMRQPTGIVQRALRAPPPHRKGARIFLADHVVDIAELRQFAFDGVVHHRQARHLDDAAFDGIEQAEIGDDPGK